MSTGGLGDQHHTLALDPDRGVDGAVLRSDRLLRDEPGAAADGLGPQQRRYGPAVGDQRLHAGVGRVHGARGPHRRYLRAAPCATGRDCTVRGRLGLLCDRAVCRGSHCIPGATRGGRRLHLSGVGQRPHQCLPGGEVESRHRIVLRHSGIGKRRGSAGRRVAHPDCGMARGVRDAGAIGHGFFPHRREDDSGDLGRNRPAALGSQRAGADHRGNRLVHVCI
jgi:hypothetical protein